MQKPDFSKKPIAQDHPPAGPGIWRYAGWITQLGVSLALPLVLCVGLARWLCSSYHWPQWVMLPAIVLGLCGAAGGFFNFYRTIKRYGKPAEKRKER